MKNDTLYSYRKNNFYKKTYLASFIIFVLALTFSHYSLFNLRVITGSQIQYISMGISTVSLILFAYFSHLALKEYKPEIGFDIFENHFQVFHNWRNYQYPIQANQEHQFVFYPMLPLFKNVPGTLTCLKNGEAIWSLGQVNLDSKFLELLSDRKIELKTDYLIAYVTIAIILSLLITQRIESFVFLFVLVFIKPKEKRERIIVPRKIKILSFLIGPMLVLPSFLIIGTMADDTIHSQSLALLHQGKVQEAVQFLEEKNASDQNPITTNLEAWVLTTSPTRELRNYSKAVELSKQSISDTPSLLKQHLWPQFYDTLACAYFGNGQTAEAMKIAQKLHSQKRLIQFAAGSPCEDQKLYIPKNVVQLPASEAKRSVSSLPSPENNASH